MRLLNLSNRCLRVPKRGGHRWNLARLVNQQLAEERDPPPPTGHQGSAPHSTTRQPEHDPDALQFIATRISAKLEEGDFKGAVRLASSEDTVTEVSDATIAALRTKCPAAHPDTSLPPAPKEEALEAALTVSKREVADAIRSFLKASAGGLMASDHYTYWT